MRDTLGTAVPPSVIAYDGAGDVLTTFAPTFFVTDSLQQLHFSTPDGTLVVERRRRYGGCDGARHRADRHAADGARRLST